MVSIDESGSGRIKCWLSKDERQSLAREAGRDSWEREIAIQLMAECGLRSDEVPKLTLGNIRYSEEGECHLFEIAGKNTEGGKPKMRDVWLPDEVERNITKFAREKGLSESDSLVSVSASSVRRWVKEAAQKLSEKHENERWNYVSSHDLRRSWATWHLVERCDTVDVRTMMSVGGWNSYNAIEPYLDAPSEARIGQAMAPS